MKIIMQLDNNAMFYKDITQWIRNRTFLIFFFGLLGLSEIICLLFMVAPVESNDIGMICFSFLMGLLGLYTMLIAFSGFRLTSNEFANRTFELYEIAGMSLEKMVLGKFSSMLYQFLFGYFCILPFMFASHLLGGLDFFVIIGSSIVILLTAIIIYLFALLISFSSRVVKVSGFGRMIFIFIVIIFSLNIIGALISSLHYYLRSSSSMIKFLFTFNAEVLIWFSVAIALYIQICLLLFYLCCNTISRQNDSRECPVKILLFTLSMSLFGIMSYISISANEGTLMYFACIPVSIIMCISGLIFYYNRVDIPPVAKRRMENLRGLKKLIYYLFAPGAAGTFRMMLMIEAGIIIFGCLIVSLIKPGFKTENFLNAMSIPIQVPFFLYFPGSFILYFYSMRKKYKETRIMVFVWWIAASVGLMILAGIVNGILRIDSEEFFRFLSMFASPISTFLTNIGYRSEVLESTIFFRIVSGILGLYGMHRSIKYWRNMDKKSMLNIEESISNFKESKLPGPSEG
jgi:hypothetical protein